MRAFNMRNNPPLRFLTKFFVWKKMDHFFKIYWNFLTKQNFQIFGFIFFAYFYPKTWWSNQKWGNFYNLLFIKSSDLGFWSKKDFFLKFLVDIYPLDPDPWIRIILRIRIQEAKILRILSTVQIKVDLKLSDFKN